MIKLELLHLIQNPDQHLGSEVETSGILVSCDLPGLCLITQTADIATANAVAVDYPDLDILIYENVPTLGGSYLIYHRATISGTVRPGRGKLRVELVDLSHLVVEISGQSYPLL